MAPLEFRLPDIGEGIATAEIVAWKVAAGDHVTEDQELVEIQTDKAIVGIPSPVTGVVGRLGAAEGDTLDVGAVLVELEPDATPTRAPASAAGGAAPPVVPTPAAADAAPTVVPTPAAADAAPRAVPTLAADEAPAPVPTPAAVTPAGRPLASPATRRRARELGVALAEVAGSGPQGRISREDVERAATPGPPSTSPSAAERPPLGRSGALGASATPGAVVPLRGVRRSIAHGLTKAWQEVPRVIDYREVDASALLATRAALKERALHRGDEVLARALGPTPLIVKAAVRALRDHPYVNASIDLERDEITLHRHCHIGIATAAPDGLMVPVVHDAETKSLAAVALEIAELTRGARERRLRSEQLAGATFTVNNYGGLGIWLGTPIVRPPEVCNLGVGAVRDQVVAVDGVPVVRPTLVLAVAGDHRVLDGDTLAAFVTQVVGLLEHPALIFEELG